MMKNFRISILLTFATLLFSFSSFGEEGLPEYNLFILNGYGSIVAIGFTPPNRFTKAEIFGQHYWGDNSGIELLVNDKDFLQLNHHGKVVAYGDSRQVPSFNFGWAIAKAIEESPDKEKIIVLDGLGGVHSLLGEIDQIHQNYFGWDIARDLKWNPQFEGYSILDGFGKLHGVGKVPELLSPFFEKDIALAFEWTPDGKGAYLLTQSGEVFSLSESGYEKVETSDWGWDEDLARDIALSPDGKELLILDAFGAIYTPGKKEPLFGPSWNLDIAKDLIVLPGKVQLPIPIKYKPMEVFLSGPGVLNTGQEESTVSLEIKNAIDLTEFRFDLVYDPEKIKLIDEGNSSLGEFLGTSNREVATLLQNDEEKGILHFAGISLGPVSTAVSGDGHLATLRFEPLSPGISSVKLSRFYWVSLAGEFEVLPSNLDEIHLNVKKLPPKFDFFFKLEESADRISERIEVGLGKVLKTAIEFQFEEEILGVECQFLFDNKNLELIGWEEGKSKGVSFQLLKKESPGHVFIAFPGPSDRQRKSKVGFEAFWKTVGEGPSNIICIIEKIHTVAGAIEVNGKQKLEVGVIRSYEGSK